MTFLENRTHPFLESLLGSISWYQKGLEGALVPHSHSFACLHQCHHAKSYVPMWTADIFLKPVLCFSSLRGTLKSSPPAPWTVTLSGDRSVQIHPRLDEVIGWL